MMNSYIIISILLLGKGILFLRAEATHMALLGGPIDLRVTAVDKKPTFVLLIFFGMLPLSCMSV